MGVIVPVSELKANPVPNAIALYKLGEIEVSPCAGSRHTHTHINTHTRI